METNNNAHYLHHNKFITFTTPQGEAAFAGAGNLTGTAFTDNFENFYWITIPHVVKAMKDQHEHLWSLATPSDNLPATNVQPSTN
jgi:HKD family nuclease